MLEKIEFSDLYKFLTSIGLLFMAAACIIPYIFLKQDSALLMSNKDYYSLISSSKELVDNRIFFNNRCVELIPFISILLAIIGFLLIIIGIRKWQKKQSFLDETEYLHLLALRAKNVSLDSSDAEEKAKEEVKQDKGKEEKKEEKKEESKEENKEEKEDVKNKAENNNGNVNVAKEKQQLNDLMNVESIVYQKIIDFNSFNYKPYFNIKVANKYNLDIFLESYNINHRNDILIEIKYLQNKLNIENVRTSFNEFIVLSSEYRKGTSRKAKMYFFVVIKDGIAKNDEINRFSLALGHLQKETGDNKLFSVLMFTEQSIKDLNIEAFID